MAGRWALSVERFGGHGPPVQGLEKSRRIHTEPCGSKLLELPNTGSKPVRHSYLFFNNNTLNHTLLGRAGVVHADFLTGANRRRHDFASRVNNVRSCAEREADRTFRTS